MIAVTIHTLDRTADLVERVEVENVAYFKTPLRPVSNNAVNATLIESQIGAVTSFTATAFGSSIPTDPTVLTDAQAATGVELFFRPTRGYVELYWLSITSAQAPVLVGVHSFWEATPHCALLLLHSLRHRCHHLHRPRRPHRRRRGHHRRPRYHPRRCHLFLRSPPPHRLCHRRALWIQGWPNPAAAWIPRCISRGVKRYLVLHLRHFRQ